MVKLQDCVSFVGKLDVDTAEFLSFDHYTFDDIADVGAIKVLFAAKDGDAFYEVYGDFVCGTGDNIVVEVTDVCEVAKDDVGDVVTLSTESVVGVALSLPYSCVLSVLTAVYDSLKYDTEVDVFELLVTKA